MSAGTKWFIALVVLIAAGVVAWHTGIFSNLFPQPSQQTLSTNTAPQQATSTQPQNTTGLPTNSQDTSNAALQQDTAALDAQMQGLTSDSASVDQAFNDQSIQQSY